jgi:o-succinylbenzoate synthase
MIRVARLLEQRVTLPDADDDASTPPAADASRVWSERVTLLFVVEDGEGNVGLGEAAPLPAYSPDSLDDAWNALLPLVGRTVGDGELGASGSSRALRELRDTLSSPAARFAFESALLDLWARRRGEPAWALLARLRDELVPDATPDPGAAASDERRVAALVPSGRGPALRHAERASARGIRCFKAKTGARGGWAEELATLRALRQAFPDAALRVDANQCLSPAELWQRLPAFRELSLEWLEEPVARFPAGIEPQLGVPLALDESLQADAPAAADASEHGVRAYVLKPTTLGGLMRSLELAADARNAGLAVVASHAYEGPVGFSAVAALSLALGGNRPPDGLDRHAGIADAPNLPALDAEHGRIPAWSEPGFGLELDELLARRPVTREARA